MSTVHRLSRADARRIAVRAQLLTRQRPPDLLTAVRRLTILQLDPVSTVAPRGGRDRTASKASGDRLVGKLDATADRKAGLLRVSAVHQDVPFTAGMAQAVEEETAGLAAWLGLEYAGQGE